MKRNGYPRKASRKMVVISMIACSSFVLAAAILFWFTWKQDKVKMSDAISALNDMQEISGESRIETLADLKEAKQSSDPEAYLMENSVYVLDEKAIDRYIQGFVAGAESTAMAMGIGTEELVVSGWGYESLEGYKSAVKEEAESFVKKRLAVYEAAGRYGIYIGKKEYDRLLGTYARRFAYASREEFTFECTPASIADEMLYDKALNCIQSGKAV